MLPFAILYFRVVSRCVLVLVLYGCTSANLRGEIAKVYYIPFSANTYGPITADMIKLSSWEVWTISDAEQVIHLRKILDRGLTRSFDNNSVRAVIYLSDRTIYLDSNCTAAEGIQTRQFDMNAFLSFRGSLQKGEIESNSY